MEVSSHRSSILKRVQKLFVQVAYLVNILLVEKMQFYKGYSTNFYQMKTLKNKCFFKFLEKFCNFSLTFEDLFLEFFII